MLKEINSSNITIKYGIIPLLLCHVLQALASIDCNFDDNLCGWKQDMSDYFDWRRQSGSTPSINTGPLADHTTGENGHYIYIDAANQGVGDNARLRSSFEKPGQYCLILWYNMYGKGVGALKLYKKIYGNTKTLLLTKDVNVGDRNWRKAAIYISTREVFQIVIEGVRGYSSEGDIAVDDISMTHGSCTVTVGEDKEENSAGVAVPIVLTIFSILAIIVVLTVVIFKRRKQQSSDDIYHVYSEPDELGMTSTFNNTKSATTQSLAVGGRLHPVKSNLNVNRNNHGMVKVTNVSGATQVPVNETKMSIERSSDDAYGMHPG